MTTENKNEVVEKETSNLTIPFVKTMVATIESDMKGGMIVPDTYPLANAIQDAYLSMISNPASAKTSETSRVMAVKQMVAMELLPSKTQCYFIPMGDKMTLMPSYLGMQSYARSVAGVKEFRATLVLKGEDFGVKMVDDKPVVDYHNNIQMFKTDSGIKIDDIVGVYSVAFYYDGSKDYEFMDIQDVQAAWNKSKTNKATHREFPSQMVKKSVLSRHAKRIASTTINTELNEHQLQKQRAMKDIFDEDLDNSTQDKVEVPQTAFKKTVTPSFDIEDELEILDAESVEVKESSIQEETLDIESKEETF